MIPNCLWFQNFIELEGDLVLLGEKNSYNITKVGTIKICLHYGTGRVLEEVRFVTSLKCNLISLNEL